MERTIRLINIKSHDDKELDLSNDFIAIVGKNQKGKSTVVQALKTIFSAQGFMEDPIKHGESEGSITYSGKDGDGNPCIIKWTVTPKGAKFKATVVKDGKNKVISNVKDIRALLGTFFPLSAQEALHAMLSLPTRRKFYEEYLLPCLSEEDGERIKEIDLMISSAKNTETDGNLFHTRTELKKELESAQSIYENTKISPEEEELLSKEPKIIELIEKLETLIKEIEYEDKIIQDYDTSIINGNKLLKQLNNAWEEYEVIEVKDHYLAFKEALEEAIQLKIEERNHFESMDLDFDVYKKLEERKKQLSNVEFIKQKAEGTKKYEEARGKLMKQVAELDDEIERLRAEKAHIIANSELPAGLEIDDDYYVTLDGFKFHETVVSDTQARIAILALLDAISTADFIDIGDWSLYDSISREKIREIFKGQDRLIIGQLVTEDDEVKAEVVIED